MSICSPVCVLGWCGEWLAPLKTQFSSVHTKLPYACRRLVYRCQHHGPPRRRADKARTTVCSLCLAKGSKHGTARSACTRTCNCTSAHGARDPSSDLPASSSTAAPKHVAPTHVELSNGRVRRGRRAAPRDGSLVVALRAGCEVLTVQPIAHYSRADDPRNPCNPIPTGRCRTRSLPRRRRSRRRWSVSSFPGRRQIRGWGGWAAAAAEKRVEAHSPDSLNRLRR